MNNDPVKYGIEKFEGKIIRTSGRVDKYLEKNPGKLPSAEKRGPRVRLNKGQESISQWEQLATQVVYRNFTNEPIDESTKQSMMAGFRGCGTPVCVEALKKLEEVKCAAWTQKDVKAGMLLPRTKKGKQNDSDN